ncbi:MAG: hypothetical protein ABSD27_08310, partial [Bryobacteraceae bacterium]
LNLLILIPFLASVMLFTRALGMAQLRFGGQHGPLRWLWWSWVPAIGIAVAVIGLRLRRIVLAEPKANGTDKTLMPLRRELFVWIGRVARWLWRRVPALGRKGASWSAVTLSMLGACIVGTGRFQHGGFPTTFGIFFALFLGLQLLGGFCFCFWNRHKGGRWGVLFVFLLLVIPLLCAAVTGGCMILLWGWLQGMAMAATPWIPITFGPGLVVLIWIGGVSLQIGLMGADFPDTAREWLAQFGSMLAIIASVWVGLLALSVYGPLWLTELALWKLPAGVAALVAWVTAGAASYFTGKSSRTIGAAAGARNTSPTLERIATVAPPIFMALSLLLVSFGAHMAVRAVVPPEQRQNPQADIQTKAKTAGAAQMSGWLEWLEPVRDHYWYVIDVAKPVTSAPKTTPSSAASIFQTVLAWIGETPFQATCVLSLAGFLAAFLLSLRVNINEFSMHHFYKNRLVRCYLGAGRAENRKPDLLTGFDPNDDFKIAALRADPAPPDAAASDRAAPHTPAKQRPYNGPYPIVNCALNLNTGSELATAERKAASFVFTPRVCGFEPAHSELDKQLYERRCGDLSAHGYSDTDGFMMPEGPALGTAMAISGAAVNPNAGYHTSTPLAFLLTVFNVRLGCWVGNPRRARKRARPGPRVALWSLLAELFAQSDSRSAYLNLSDGGHFENLGLYELVRRRCRYIIVGDAEEDPHYTFAALGGAIRKCRADFGVEITINPDSLRPAKDKPYSGGHCVVGTIRYPEQDAAKPEPMCSEADPDEVRDGRMRGWLVYFKASLTGDEPEDIQQYQAGHGGFPHEPTSDQFFGESQFESYRRLGQHVVETTFERIKERLSDGTANDRLLDLFQDLYRKWHPVPGEEKTGNYTERYNSLMKRLAEDKDLEFIGCQFFRKPHKVLKPTDPDVDRKAFYFCLDAIQLMEDVYFDLDFYSKEIRFSPGYAGWMSTFGDWAASHEVQQTWEIAKRGYSKLFQEFFDGLIDDSKKRPAKSP